MSLNSHTVYFDTDQSWPDTIRWRDKQPSAFGGTLIAVTSLAGSTLHNAQGVYLLADGCQVLPERCVSVPSTLNLNILCFRQQKPLFQDAAHSRSLHASARCSHICGTSVLGHHRSIAGAPCQLLWAAAFTTPCNCLHICCTDMLQHHCQGVVQQPNTWWVAAVACRSTMFMSASSKAAWT